MGFVLASASPRRADLLRAAGFTFDVRPVDVDETRHGDEAPRDYVLRIAGAKASAAALRWPGDVIVAADTTVAIVAADASARPAVVLGKPADAEEAAWMLRRLSGRAHDVLTGVVITSGHQTERLLESTRVWFGPLSEEDIAWYVATGEPMDKAGAYAIQGGASRFIPRIDGSYANVVGLPVAQVAEALRAFMNGR